MILDRLLTPAEAAQRLNLSTSTLAKKRLNGSGPRYSKLSRSVRYSSESLDSWIRECERKQTRDDAAA